MTAFHQCECEVCAERRARDTATRARIASEKAAARVLFKVREDVARLVRRNTVKPNAEETL